MKDVLVGFLFVCCVQLQCTEPLKSWQQRFAQFIISKDRFAQVQNKPEELSAGKSRENNAVPKRSKRKTINDRLVEIAVSSCFD
ncbi:hypothetical protein HYX58_06225 [Candidatus Dependentiae bacterium]|nr:hypothetical protein [Candidatus Dependentiae bacterium]